METKLRNILTLPHRLERTAALAWWVQNLYPDKSVRPILVGGAAMELYAEGAYITADLDFVGIVPSPIAGDLRKSEFQRLGRQWLHNEESVSIIFHGETLRAGERAVQQIFGDYPVLVISPEDLLIDRLVSWRYCESPLHGIQAYLLYCGTHCWMNLEHLNKRAVQDEVESSLECLLKLFFQSRGQVPDGELLGAWASRNI